MHSTMHCIIMCCSGLSPGAGLPMDEGISMMLMTTMTMTMEIKIAKKIMMMKAMSFMMPMMTVRRLEKVAGPSDNVGPNPWPLCSI
jgi:hypothetical protein